MEPATRMKILSALKVCFFKQNTDLSSLAHYKGGSFHMDEDQVCPQGDGQADHAGKYIGPRFSNFFS